jgi:hypothetical protein
MKNAGTSRIRLWSDVQRLSSVSCYQAISCWPKIRRCLRKGKWKMEIVVWTDNNTERCLISTKMQKLLLQCDWRNALLGLQIDLKWWHTSAIRQPKITSPNYLHCKCIFWPTPPPHKPISHQSACRHSMILIHKEKLYFIYYKYTQEQLLFLSQMHTGTTIILLQVHTGTRYISTVDTHKGKVCFCCRNIKEQRIFLL